MILVTVGTHSQPFNRLVEAMDMVAGKIDERIVIQRGVSSYQPYHAEYFDFTGSQQMLELTEQARVVVTHAAAGAILISLRHCKPLVIVPRLKVFYEHRDDHQLQLARALEDEGRAIAVLEPTPFALHDAILKADTIGSITSGTGRLETALHAQLERWSSAIDHLSHQD